MQRLTDLDLHLRLHDLLQAVYERAVYDFAQQFFPTAVELMTYIEPAARIVYLAGVIGYDADDNRLEFTHDTPGMQRLLADCHDPEPDIYQLGCDYANEVLPIQTKAYPIATRRTLPNQWLCIIDGQAYGGY